jgi:hypothetical protein
MKVFILTFGSVITLGLLFLNGHERLVVAIIVLALLTLLMRLSARRLSRIVLGFLELFCR